MHQEAEILIGKDVLSRIPEYIISKSFSSVFVLVDENTFEYCYSELKEFLPKHHLIEIESGEGNKTISTCERIWRKLTEENADREALLINLGGGVLSDLGGFAAGCYKRGIKYINVPTTLLAMVDASVGSKTGVDFMNFKNQIGLFYGPQAIFIYTDFLRTLTEKELYAGFSEVIKHYLIADAEAFYEISDLFLQICRQNISIKQIDWEELVKKNIYIKSQIVDKDKFEKADRKALNFGHTIAHAMESYYLNKGYRISHGMAVGIGILCESRISIGPGTRFAHIQLCIFFLFKDLPELPQKDIPEILRLIKQDKKNTGGHVQFTLLEDIGTYSINNVVEESVITENLKYYSEYTEIYDADTTSN
jgi:3-dehydroquinate synthase